MSMSRKEDRKSRKKKGSLQTLGSGEHSSLAPGSPTYWCGLSLEARTGFLNPAAKSWGPGCPHWCCWQETFRKELLGGNNMCYVMSTFKFCYIVRKFHFFKLMHFFFFREALGSQQNWLEEQRVPIYPLSPHSYNLPHYQHPSKYKFFH